MSRAYYNEFDPYAAQWLRNLVEAGLIADGDVDDRSIVDVTPDDIAHYTQCHFFAGIGVWSYALRRAGWSDDREVWTGSCPCQPFSHAGSAHGTNKGVEDERHLWPEFYRLIRTQRPDVVFGEQVASKDGLSWLDDVQADLEAASYTVGAVDTCAAGFGAPHIRQRLYFVAQIGGFTSDTGCIGAQGHGEAESVGELRPWGSFGTMDLQSITDSPFIPGRGWPQPLLRKMDDGFAGRMGGLHAYGNAIVTAQAQGFIEAYREISEAVQ